ncbi:hypothetical protein OH76DRAFT_1351456 [Lentinus brumalis]|uniref:BTB domain-containing protein n=1 Tax=Lentinus brumalis TaxID=2498619 RepID=A0A371D8Z3_9APHY|nr:hypothetical protein OH76DRAFT_1351456 [Polyporus brumalis]
MTQAKKARGDAPELVRDEEFWYEDGTIILVARNVQFRVYKGVLADHSSVFADMFSLPQPASTLASTTSAECPVVHLEDSPEDLRHVLRALLPKKSALVDFAAERPTFHEISAQARLGHKYQIDTLFERSLSYLKTCFTTDFDARQRWLTGNRYSQVPVEWGGHGDKVFAIGVVNIARLAQADTILPSALAVCCSLAATRLVKGFEREDGSWERLSEEDLELCFTGMRRLAHEASVAVVTEFARFILPNGCTGEADCQNAINQLLSDYGDNSEPYFPSKNPFRDWDDWITEYWEEEVEPEEDAVCETCSAKILKGFRVQQRDTWKRLPDIFDLPVKDWPI